MLSGVRAREWSTSATGNLILPAVQHPSRRYEIPSFCVTVVDFTFTAVDVIVMVLSIRIPCSTELPKHDGLLMALLLRRTKAVKEAASTGPFLKPSRCAQSASCFDGCAWLPFTGAGWPRLCPPNSRRLKLPSRGVSLMRGPARTLSSLSFNPHHSFVPFFVSFSVWHLERLFWIAFSLCLTTSGSSQIIFTFFLFSPGRSSALFYPPVMCA
jgi:hypothetical protein